MNVLDMNAVLSLPVCFNNYLKLGHMDKSGMYKRILLLLFIKVRHKMIL